METVEYKNISFTVRDSPSLRRIHDLFPGTMVDYARRYEICLRHMITESGRRPSALASYKGAYSAHASSGGTGTDRYRVRTGYVQGPYRVRIGSVTFA